jgi:hypothetical protein
MVNYENIKEVHYEAKYDVYSNAKRNSCRRRGQKPPIIAEGRVYAPKRKWSIQLFTLRKEGFGA